MKVIWDAWILYTIVLHIIDECQNLFIEFDFIESISGNYVAETHFMTELLVSTFLGTILYFERFSDGNSIFRHESSKRVYIWNCKLKRLDLELQIKATVTCFERESLYRNWRPWKKVPEEKLKSTTRLCRSILSPLEQIHSKRPLACRSHLHLSWL